jgi:hypothetical protein
MTKKVVKKVENLFEITTDDKNIIEITLKDQSICKILATDKNITIKFEKPLHIIFEDFMASIKGEADIISKGDVSIDTLNNFFGGMLHLNSRTAKQIRHFEESIKYREKQKKLINEFKCSKSAFECPCDEPCDEYLNSLNEDLIEKEEEE